MKVREIYPDSKPVQHLDWSDLEQAGKAMIEASECLSRMADAVGTARQIKEFAGDRKKQILAAEMRQEIKDGTSAAAAETLGRSSLRYAEQLDAQAKQLEAAEQQIAAWESCRIRWESARSVLSSLKSIAGNV